MTSLALLAAANPAPVPQSSAEGCTLLVDNLLCCQEFEPGDAPILGPIFELLGLLLPGVNTLVGLQCTSTNAVEVALGSCLDGNVGCCDINDLGGVVALGCHPVTLL
ncbi:hypothetical protein A0H81_02283 [Grifola frondosa]|uniref:Hydrophobin n=1 Tax=Grifola frondosa TaxID=5627 RepID=A0A1C7MMN6_GRIFR|nr:hypothetical protein A0H81_02283 [Grifola frondosa]